MTGIVSTESADHALIETQNSVEIYEQVEATPTISYRKRHFAEMEGAELPPAKSPIVRSSSWESNLSETFSIGNISSETTTGTVPSDDHSLVEASAVRIPDMFSSIMSIDPLLNPHYEKVKIEADAWAAMSVSFHSFNFISTDHEHTLGCTNWTKKWPSVMRKPTLLI
jgi:hypothetical protein